jgi:chromosome segregation ATPase
LESISSDFKQLSISGKEVADLREENADLKRRLDALQEAKAQSEELGKLAIEDSSRLQRERNDLAQAKFELVTKDAASTEAYDKLAKQYQNMGNRYRANEKRCDELSESYKALCISHTTMEESYTALKTLVDEIQAGNIVKVCTDCPELRDTLGTMQAENEAAQRQVDSLKQEIEQQRESSKSKYDQLNATILSACSDRDRFREELTDTRVNLATEKAQVQQLKATSAAQEKLVKETASALESKQDELDVKAREYDGLKQSLDGKCKEVSDLLETNRSNLENLRSEHKSAIERLNKEHEDAIERLDKEHEDAKHLACEALERLHDKSFNSLAGEKARREMELQASIDELMVHKQKAQEQIQSLMAANGVPSPISPQEESADGIFSDAKKRKLDQFEGSPESKAKRAWTQHASRVGAIISNMVPDGSVDADQAYYEIARCFALTSAIEKFRLYFASGNRSWFCLSSLLTLGIADARPVNDLDSICKNCEETYQECCVRVQARLESVRFYLVLAEVGQE